MTSAKKILIFSMAYHPHVGGAEIAIKEITNRLAAGGSYEFHLIANRYDSALSRIETIENVVVHRIGFTNLRPSMADLRRWPLRLNKILYQWLAYRKAKSLHKQHQYDAVWAMMAHSAGIPASRFKKAFPKVKYILTLQEGDPPAKINKQMRVFGSWWQTAFSSADVVQAISTFLANWAKEMGFVGKTVVVPNAVDVSLFSQTHNASDLESLTKKLNKKPGDVFLITTSRLVHKNAVDDVLRALVDLPSNVRFIVCGIGPDEDALKALAAKLGVTDRVEWCQEIAHHELPQYLKASDIFIRPSRSEGMGNSFIEAMAAGLPVVATQEGGISDFMFDEKLNPEKPTTGWAVAKDSPKAIAAAVLEIVEDKEKVKAVTATAKTMVSERYDWDLVATQMKKEVFDPLFL